MSEQTIKNIDGSVRGLKDLKRAEVKPRQSA
jgi:hypothetical protein